MIIKLKKIAFALYWKSKGLLGLLRKNLITVIEVVALLVLIYQSVQTREQLKFAKESLDLSRESTAMQLRPFVYITGMTAHGMEPNSMMRFTLKLTHSGATPALSVYVCGTYKILPYGFGFAVGEISKNGSLTEKASLMTLGGGQDMTSTFSTVSLSEDEWTKLKEFKVLFIYGVVRYRDLHGTEYETGFCTTWDKESGQMSPYKDFNYMK